MGKLLAAERFAARQARKLLAPMHQRQHHAARHRAREATPSPPGDAWWADEPRWFPGGTPPRRRNRVAPLIDGDAYFGALHEALTGAQHYVYIVGWALTPHIPLRRGHVDACIDTRLLALLAEVAARVPVRVLLWSGAPFLFQPTVRETEAVQRTLEQGGGPNLLCRLDRSAHFSHCHHQKAVVVDGRVAFVGGMDLTTFQGDRWDLPGHPLRNGQNWHDAALRIEGEAVADVEHNFRQRWAASGEDGLLPQRAPQPEEGWETPVQIARTIPRRVYDVLPEGEFGIHHLYVRLLRGARRLIYLENQYLWSPEVIDALIAAMDARRDEPLRIVIVLPAAAYEGKWDNDRHVQQLREADRGRGIVSVYCPYAWGPANGKQPFRYRPVYVHAKVAAIDDEWLLIGSANLNTRGLATDSEIVAAVHDATIARETRIRLWSEHLALSPDEVAAADPAALADHAWPERAARNAEIIRAAQHPLIGTLHRYETGDMPGAWFLEEAEALTVEH